MSNITTKLITPKGEIGHVGTSGFTVTATREGDNVETRIEYSDIATDEMREMVCVLLCMLDDLQGEPFVASCFARYAQETGKRFMSEGNGRKLVMIRGR
jgi:hypothetical protein